MSIRNSSKSSLFLIELIIAILFFAIGSAVCVRAFVKAHDLSMRAKDLSFASAQASSAASVLEYTDGSFSSFPRIFRMPKNVEMRFSSIMTLISPSAPETTLSTRCRSRFPMRMGCVTQ